MNILLKFLPHILGVGLILGIGGYAVKQWNDHWDEYDRRGEAEETLTENNAELTRTIDRMEAVQEARKEFAVQIDALNEQLEEADDRAQEAEATQTAVLDDRERMERINKAKPSLFAKLANRATKERFDEIESIANSRD